MSNALNTMKNFLYAVVIALQLLYIIGIAIFIQEIIGIVNFLVELNQIEGPKPHAVTILSQKISVAMSGYLPTLIAFIGLLISWFTLTKNTKLPRWYISINRYLSILWLFYFPLGTLVGYFQLRQIQRLRAK